MRLLLLSNSSNYNSGYLEHARPMISDFLGSKVKRVAFVPYAGVTVGWDDYTAKVAEVYRGLGYQLESVHTADDPVAAVRSAEAIAVGGGNTFHLLETMYKTGVFDAVRERATLGVPYMGWSAGSNMACPTIKTTNDMPIVEPRKFDALRLIPFQINPHYTDAVLPKHKGETRGDRLAEFLVANPEMTVVGLREGSALRIEGKEVSLLGDNALRIFKKGEDPREVPPGDSLDFLMR